MANSVRRTEVAVVGAGIGGLTAAVALRRLGVGVRIYERATELRAAGSALSVMGNAIGALRSLGIDLGLEKRGQVIETFSIRDTRGELIRDLPIRAVTERLGVPSVCITRADLQEALLEGIGDVPLTLGAALSGYEAGEAHGPGGPGVTLRFEDGSEARADAVIGADGFNSAVRRQLAGPEESRDGGYICWLAVVPFEHPALRPGYVGHYWGAGRRFGLVDVGHGRYYWWGTKNMPAARSYGWDGGKDEIAGVYAGWADEVTEIIRATPAEAVLAVPSRDRAFLERWGEGPVTLLGDAAHPMLTSLGQGSAMAVEDAVVLARGLAAAPGDPAAAFRAYEDERRERTRGMVAASRSLSELEQLSDPGECTLRDERLRLTGEEELIRQQEAALRWPG
ncbi:NAD(P)/FAD-dependent oxidoreductase [Streptomyces amakusaensis]|uniref:FAD-dependent monooxygenase n=1 Tax=Streptomyces amakusaensis TaxID=67271 RepID=A0ABW0AN90_9ACTN